MIPIGITTFGAAGSEYELWYKTEFKFFQHMINCKMNKNYSQFSMSLVVTRYMYDVLMMTSSI